MLLCLRSTLLSEAGFRHGFSLRTGGASRPPFASLNLARNLGDAPADVSENHRRLASQIGYDGDRLYEVSQVHGRAVEQVDVGVSPAVYRAREADALVLRDPGYAVGVRVADCVPILLAHPGSGAVAAIHAGWRGVVAGVLEAGVRRLCEAVGAPASELVAALGPHIGADAFEVSHEVAQQVADSAPSATGVVIAREPRPHVSLASALCAQLARAGLAAERVECVPGCTFSDSERFFSFRRDGDRSGRHLAAIVAGC